jgi:hypothetical protein
MDEAKAQIYNYIRDQHDKHVAHRESLTSRFGNVRLTAGLILTIFSFSLGVVVRSLENANGNMARVLGALPLIFFAIALYFVTRSLLNIPDLVGTIHIHFPAVDQTKINKVLKRAEMNADKVIEDLSQNYMEAIKINVEAKRAAGEQLERCVRFIRLALFATIAFLVSTLMTSIVAGWLFQNHK